MSLEGRPYRKRAGTIQGEIRFMIINVRCILGPLNPS